ncbi:hypothetical protein Tco_0715492 [Tanacetum coccineum]
MWIAIERLQQGESLNVQDVKTNLFWEFRKFTSRDGESMESYYSRFYKLMNELTRNNLQVTTMQVNVQFLSTTSTRMVKICDDCQAIRKVRQSSHIHLVILNKLRGQGKCNKNLALPCKVFQEAHTNYQQQLSNFFKLLGTRLKIPHSKYTMKISQAVRNHKGHLMDSCWGSQSGERLRVSQGKVMMCKQAEQGVPLQAEQADWLEDTDEEIDEQELEAHYSYMAKIQEVSPEESSSTGQPLEKVDQNAVECVMPFHMLAPNAATYNGRTNFATSKICPEREEYNDLLKNEKVRVESK